MKKTVLAAGVIIIVLMLLTGCPGPTSSGDTSGNYPGVTLGDLVINEVDYDNVGADTAEFIELYNKSSETLHLDSVFVVLYNGFSNTEYASFNLEGTLGPGEYFILCNNNGSDQPSIVVGGAAYKLMGISNQIQNGGADGDGDGIALIETSTGVVLDVLSYEGEISSVTHPSVSGSFSLVKGTATSAFDNSSSQEMSLIRRSSTGDDATDWVETTTLTPGAENVLTP